MKRSISLILSVLLMLSAFSLIAYADVVEVNVFEATVDYSKIFLSAEHTEGEVEKNIARNFEITFDGSKNPVGSLGYLYNGVTHGIGYGEDQVKLDRQYMVELYSELKPGYDWIDSVKAIGNLETKPLSEIEGFSIIINGEEVTDAVVWYNEPWNAVRVYIPMEPATERDSAIFPDVADDSWYRDAAYYNATRGWITGYKDGRFGPADNLQRQDFVVILGRISGVYLPSYTSCTLSDVDMTAYYGNSVAWAVTYNIIKGYENGKFGVGDSITREQVATILYRYSLSPAVTDAEATLAPFADAGRISPFAKDAMVWAIQNGVISGKKADTLAPTATASRAEIATMIMRMDKAGMLVIT
jgi:hypothetical protein